MLAPWKESYDNLDSILKSRDFANKGPYSQSYAFSSSHPFVAHMVKNLPTMQEIQVRSLGQEDLLEKEMATHSSYSCPENYMDRGAWRNRGPWSHKELDMTE